jgi:hypothetical protein
VTLAQRQKPYKALTYLHLPFSEVDKRPGDLVDPQELIDAKQTDEDVETLVANGSLGEEDDDLHPSTIIPDPAMPTIASVVADAQRLVAELEEAGEEVPAELKATADLDYTHAVTGDTGKSGESNA